MLDLFLSRKSLNMLKKFKSNFKKISICTLLILVVLGGLVTIDFFLCDYVLSGEMTKIDEDTKIEIEKTEEMVSSYKDQILDASSFYNSNYDNLSYELKHNFELEFNELEITIEKRSDEDTYILAEYNSETIEYALNENVLVKVEKEEPLVLYCVAGCILIDFLIIFLLFLMSIPFIA